MKIVIDAINTPIIPINPDLYKRPINYTVKVGDTLSRIANNHKINLEKMMSDNNIKTSRINIGDKIVIKFR